MPEKPEQNDRFRHEAEIERKEWLISLQEVLERAGPERVRELFSELSVYAHEQGVELPYTANTPYINTIKLDEQPRYPGNLEIEERIESIVRWNAMAMVVRANREEKGIGGHISTYASVATLYEVGYNHFFRARGEEHPGDFVYFQGHATPGNYARAFLEGRIPVEQVDNFRHELHEKPGLSSYPHPWLMPEFWKFPTVSMGLGPIQAIYHARFIRYLEDRGLKEPTDQKVWAFLGDGETDEPEALGAISVAAREHLDNLIFVINCNLQRLDGPVRGNGKIIQELEANFRGVGWNVIKVIWGGDWDSLLDSDDEGLLVRRMNAVVDGQLQKYSVESGEYIRNDFFGADPRLLALVEHLSDDQLRRLKRGGHDREKVYAAYKAAVNNTGTPTVILAQTIKGYGLGESGEGKNITHQQKKLNEQELRQFRDRFSIPLSDEDVAKLPFYRPPDESAEMKYLQKRRQELGGYNPERWPMQSKLKAPGDELFKEFHKGSGERAISTTMAFVRILSKLLKDDEIGQLIVPIIPDEARTFGMETLFRQCGIYSHPGQLYEPVDRKNLLYYREKKDGQILEEGITEAGSMSSFLAAGSAYSNHGINTIPFFMFYSMFGFQRVGDLIWAAGDSRCKGFLVGGTSGRTTLAGEGLQHQDGNSHLLAFPVPNLISYDPAYAYEMAVIVQDGIRRMYEEGEDIFYYLTMMNENYVQPPMPDGVREGILKGMYRVRPAESTGGKKRAQLFGSGAILNEALKAQAMLAEDYNVAADVWSVTSYKELHRDALDCERWNFRHPGESPRVPYVSKCLEDAPGPIIAATDYVKAVPDSVCRWLPRRLIALGTDGFGRSDGREALREFFEVDAKSIVLATLGYLHQEGKLEAGKVTSAIKDLGIDPDKPNPLLS
ncbi:MAG: pyruvate dehydrogenase (acetyl-transferring), homodimeric type [Candidatus Pacebacteria bacterium]|nr:pyruvate dehydrogenase (acetyl-transferring), homodimeric type [Candidatus Paceibacterota bacterium]